MTEQEQRKAGNVNNMNGSLKKKKSSPKMLVNGGLMWIQSLGMRYTPTSWREARCLTISEVK